jgi:hypothetical protein
MGFRHMIQVILNGWKSLNRILRKIHMTDRVCVMDRWRSSILSSMARMLREARLRVDLKIILG